MGVAHRYASVEKLLEAARARMRTRLDARVDACALMRGRIERVYHVINSVVYVIIVSPKK